MPQEALINLLVQIIRIGLYPLTEELVFRGLVYQKNEDSFLSGRQPQSFQHFLPYHGNIVQLVYAFPWDFFCSLVLRTTGNLSLPVLLPHQANLLQILGSSDQGFGIR